MAKRSHITDKEAQAVADFASDIAVYLALPRYRFLIMEEPCEEDSLASISTVEGRWIAQIALSEEWMKRDEDERMNCVVHEVLHLLHRDVDNVVNQFQRYSHTYEFEPLAVEYRYRTELMVDHLATFISEHTTIKESWDLSRKKK